MPSIRLVIKKEKKLAYMVMAKVGSMSIPRTFLSSTDELQAHDEKTKAAYGASNYIYDGWEISQTLFRDLVISREPALYQPPLPHLEGFIYDETTRSWTACGFAPNGTWLTRGLYPQEINEHFVFTFVRNPFRRLVSFFQNKFTYDETSRVYASISELLFDYFEFTDFTDMIEKIVAMEDEVMDDHFYPQANYLKQFNLAGGTLDFVGKIENIGTDFPLMAEKYDLLPLEHINASGNKNVLWRDWRDYYTPALVHLVYDRYKEDFQQFHYEEERMLLLAYLESRTYRTSPAKLLASTA